MPSPFPGMNPYLERAAVWNDFHDEYVHRLRAQLARQVLPRYVVRVEEHVYLHEYPESRAVLVGQPDVSVTARTPPAAGPAVAATPAPFTIELSAPLVEERVRYLQVVDRAGGQVVTAIEVLSPVNKYAGTDRDRYLNKRLRLTRGGVNFVEIDLLRGGPRTVPDPPACDYLAVVIRPPYWGRADAWPVRLREQLPAVPVPLRPGEPEPLIDLQAALHALYDEVGYGHFIYDGDPEPRLSAEDAAWAAALIPSRA